MGRPLRHLQPATTWFVTTRCLEARFFLRSEPWVNSTVGVHLARACARFPGIQILGVMVLSNHMHLLLIDDQSQLSGFMEYFLGQLARDLNRFRQRRGYVFDRRFSAEPVLDELALRDRLLYLILNPVQADLVERHEQWPGLCLFAKSEPVSHPFRRFRQDRYDAARRQTPPGQQPPNPIDFYEHETLVIHPLPRLSDKPVAPLMEEIRHSGKRRAGRSGSAWARACWERPRCCCRTRLGRPGAPSGAPGPCVIPPASRPTAPSARPCLPQGHARAAGGVRAGLGGVPPGGL